jgi:hypothetical protein
MTDQTGGSHGDEQAQGGRGNVFGPTPPKQPQSEGTLPSAAEAKGFLSMLVDFKFASFVTPKIVRFLYILAFILHTIGAIIVLIAGLAAGGAVAVLSLIFVPLLWIIYVAVSRVGLEILYVVFNAFRRIADDESTI